MISWAGMFLFEYLAPIIEFTGWLVIPTALVLGALNLQALLWLVLLAFGAGLMTSLAGLMIDEVYGHYNSPSDTSRLVVMALVENFGLRQMTVLWRMRALIGGKSVGQWGNMERRGVANLGV
jgi:hypothetical protein